MFAQDGLVVFDQETPETTELLYQDLRCRETLEITVLTYRGLL